MPFDDPHLANAFIKEVCQLFDEAQKFPLHSAILHLFCGIGMLMLSLFGGGNLPLTYGAILSLLVTSFAQFIIFSWLYFKNVPHTDCLTDLLSSLLCLRPYLVLAFAISPVVICLFICSAIIGLIDITHVPAPGDFVHSHLYYFLPGMFSIGMGVTFAVVEVIPMRIHYVYIKKISLIQDLCAVVMPLEAETPLSETGLQSLACDLSETFQRRPLSQFLDGMCRRGLPRITSRMTETCEVLSYTHPHLDPPPPPSYWHMERQQREQERLLSDPPIYFISGAVHVVHVESGELPPVYTSNDNLSDIVDSLSLNGANSQNLLDRIRLVDGNKDRQTYNARHGSSHTGQVNSGLHDIK